METPPTTPPSRPSVSKTGASSTVGLRSSERRTYALRTFRNPSSDGGVAEAGYIRSWNKLSPTSVIEVLEEMTRLADVEYVPPEARVPDERALSRTATSEFADLSFCEERNPPFTAERMSRTGPSVPVAVAIREWRNRTSAAGSAVSSPWVAVRQCDDAPLLATDVEPSVRHHHVLRSDREVGTPLDPAFRT